MKRIILFLLGALLLTAQAEEIDSPLVHADEMASEFVAVDISPVITFQTDEAGVFAVVVLASSEELSTPAPEPSPAPSVTPDFSVTPALSEELVTEEAEEPVIVEAEDQRATFLITSSFTARSITYTLTPVQSTDGGEIEGEIH